MALPTGTRLGPYEITGSAGAGGMGEVYKARDTRLGRTIAVKILPADFAADADRRQRFEREARVIASLSHPNICALHDVGTESLGTPGSPVAYLVMEYLQGGTLADRLARGALPTADIIRYGSEIATALHAAHRQQIVHRDLKPGNIMLTPAGVKLLDFGLAKASATSVPIGDSLTTYAADDVTMPGAMLGTLPYMAPEQVEGRPADARSDIFALGAVLYEMATGHRAFGGSSPASVTSVILTSNPPPVATFPRLDRIIRTCLEKDPERRWQSAHDVAVQLAALAENDVAAAPVGLTRSWWPWGVTAASVLAALAMFAWGASRGPVPSAAGGIRGPVALPLAPPTGGAFNQFVEWIHFAVSPDGNSIAYAARTAGGPARLWLRDLASITSRPLEGTDGVTSVFWSPDGRSLAFFAGGRLMRVDLPSGAPVKISDVRAGIGQAGTWGADGQILFGSVQGDVLQRVHASGGTPVDLLRPDPGRGELRLLWPAFLPDGRRFLYLVAQRDDTGVVMLAGPDAEPREVLRVRSGVQYVEPGYLLYVNDSTLVARRFDPVTTALSGDPIAIADRVSYFRATGVAHFSASPTGVVAYHQAQDESRIAAFDRASGSEVRQVRPPGRYQSFRLSPDGRRLVFDRVDSRSTTLDAWMLDLDRDAEIRLTDHPTTEAFPIWGPDESILYASVRGASPQLVRRSIRTGAEEALSPDNAGAHFPQDVSRDGQWLLYGRRLESGIANLLLHRFSGQDAVIFREAASEGRFSPDGTYVAFVSGKSGQPDVVIAPVAGGAGTPVSTGGGRAPRWSHDGRELFYIGTDGELMAVTVRLRPAVELGKPVRLFQARGTDGWWGTYEVASDGRFLALVRTKVSAEQPLTVLVNWRAR